MNLEALAIASAATVGLLELVKRMILPKDKDSRGYEIGMRFVPLFAVALGIGSAWLFVGTGLTKDIAGVGILIALASMGLYSGAMTTAGK